MYIIIRARQRAAMSHNSLMKCLRHAFVWVQTVFIPLSAPLPRPLTHKNPTTCRAGRNGGQGGRGSCETGEVKRPDVVERLMCGQDGV